MFFLYLVFPHEDVDLVKANKLNQCLIWVLPKYLKLNYSYYNSYFRGIPLKRKSAFGVKDLIEVYLPQIIVHFYLEIKCYGKFND